MENYLDLFISEVETYIETLNKNLLKLEKNHEDREAVLEVFRIFHTIKGMSQAMGYDTLGQITHRLEDLISAPKEEGRINPELVDFLFLAVDYLTDFIHALKEKKELPSGTEILEHIEKVARGEMVETLRERHRARSINEIRIKTEKLDRLFNLTNELMIQRSRLLHISQEIGNSELTTVVETSARFISALQDEVMRLRMLPLSTVFDFFPRLIRDEAKRQGKRVNFEIVGADIEVDRSIIDVLKEPLLHLLRNALDHGIEKKGEITLTAVRERERIRISVADNGQGIDLAEVREKAVEKHIITPQEAQELQEKDILRIIIHPDFSTTEKVSTISGRGIGLDVVSAIVDKLGGRFELSTKKGEGTCFTLDLPLSLAIVRAMIFSLDGHRFALPLNYIQETFYAEETSFQTVYHRELYPFRDEILPLIRPGDYLNCTSNRTRKSIIVLQYQGRRRGFVTDEIIDEEEIVVKKLDALASSPYYSGCSIYADGKPILILDPRGFE